MAGRRSEAQELDEALEAVRRAFYVINEASDKLRGAREWSVYDTWFGGFVASVFKRQHLDRADLAMRNIDLAMVAVRDELADVDVQGLGDVGDLGIGRAAGTLDIWFDNVLTDLSTGARVRKAQDRVNLLARALVVLQQDLERRRAALESGS
ncbi:hypothetical protein [Nocardioides mangrovi]|uniref:Uncharacterized protein n=1 Tax=Nocardioides mangrovi TaxID=2874580 RepID=A0ABS7UGS7_9ACTN|nr:hypothetical protein [Nocardioides mangrovi]MBZ5739797.1 hypothetical protein [Nocardioides mangrovi]